jgi:hypothetical protein
VDSPNHSYLCGKGWIPTHNTEAGNNWIGYVIHHARGGRSGGAGRSAHAHPLAAFEDSAWVDADDPRNLADRARIRCPGSAPLERLRWDKGKPETAHYLCEACDGRIEEHHKTAMLKAGGWRATAQGADSGTIGFHLSALYSPFAGSPGRTSPGCGKRRRRPRRPSGKQRAPNLGPVDQIYGRCRRISWIMRRQGDPDLGGRYAETGGIWGVRGVT